MTALTCMLSYCVRCSSKMCDMKLIEVNQNAKTDRHACEILYIN